MNARLRLADLLGGLSIVADMGFGLPPETAMRACVIGTALARKLELPEGDVADLVKPFASTEAGTQSARIVNAKANSRRTM